MLSSGKDNGSDVASMVQRTAAVYDVLIELRHWRATVLADTSPVHYSSVQDGVYALGKAYKYALHPVSQKFH